MSIAALTALDTSPVRAQQRNDKAAAEQLFLQSRDLMRQGAIDQACAGFEASQKLDPALGTLLNLALCREKQGKIASAWALYREAAVQARREGQEKREAAAREAAAALEAALPRLIIEVAEASQISGLSVKRDGMAVEPTLFGKAMYSDPGAYRIVAQAPGYKEFVTEIEIEKGKVATVAIPMLEREAGAQEASIRDVPAQDVHMQDLRSGRTRKITGLGIGGAGIAATAVGLGLGWSARSAWDDAFSSGLCDRDTLKCWPAGQHRTESARSLALASNVLMGVGVALAVTGTILYVTAPGWAEETGVAVIPVAGPSELGVTVQGGF